MIKRVTQIRIKSRNPINSYESFSRTAFSLAVMGEKQFVLNSVLCNNFAKISGKNISQICILDITVGYT